MPGQTKLRRHLLMPRIITLAQRTARWRGLGDVIASATKALGIRKCGSCSDRQKKLNQAFPFRIASK
jgi:hypothetical protein